MIGTPYEALADGHPAISLAMNWHDEDGRFRGVVALVGPPDVLDGDFARGVAGPDTRVDVHRLDGSVLNPRAATGGRKLESLGKLAGGVAHDVNNVLAAVIGYGELARLAAPDGSRQAQQLDQVLQAGERGRQVVQRLLAAGRGRCWPTWWPATGRRRASPARCRRSRWWCAPMRPRSTRR
ncbi:histidine kinase dimerization/phospho-acceptor domain-containing protein [Piscinibacter sakaiensis]|uniref:PDC sensor domain-containing protein n=1 Tax=Piscinibacter sakaiensis TaxID=1547922 RepID=UPI00372C119B